MDTVLATVTLKSITGIPRDDFNAGFVIRVGHDITPANVDAELFGPLRDFYNVNAGGGGGTVALSYAISQQVSRAANATITKLYDLTGHLDGSPHGSPIETDAWTLGAASAADDLPSEVAVVMTLRGLGWQTQLIERPDADVPPDDKVDRPRQRRTGRMYFGPVNGLAKTGTHDPTVSVTMRDSLGNAANALQDTLSAFGHHWTVWSRKNADVHDVDTVEVDNAFDTQRRRGPRATTRTSYAVL